MKREQLREIIEGITKEQLDQIMQINGEDIENAKSELAEYRTKADDLSAQLAERDKQLKDLKEANKDNEKLASKIAELEEANKTAKADYEGKIEAMRKDYQLETELRNAKALNIKAVKALIDPEKPLEEQIAALKEAEDSKMLFGTDKQDPTPPKGTDPKPSGGEPPKALSLAEAVANAINK